MVTEEKERDGEDEKSKLESFPPSPETETKIKSKSGADSVSVDTPRTSNSNKDTAPGVVSQNPKHEEEDGTKGEVENEEEELEEDPILERCTTFNMDEADSLNYH